MGNLIPAEGVLLIPDPAAPTKHAPSEVPLSSRALIELKSLPRSVDGRIFPIVSANAISMAFTRACKREGIEDLRFHDLRHEATSRMT